MRPRARRCWRHTPRRRGTVQCVRGRARDCSRPYRATGLNSWRVDAAPWNRPIAQYSVLAEDGSAGRHGLLVDPDRPHLDPHGVDRRRAPKQVVGMAQDVAASVLRLAQAAEARVLRRTCFRLTVHGAHTPWAPRVGAVIGASTRGASCRSAGELRGVGARAFRAWCGNIRRGAVRRARGVRMPRAASNAVNPNTEEGAPTSPRPPHRVHRPGHCG